MDGAVAKIHGERQSAKEERKRREAEEAARKAEEERKRREAEIGHQAQKNWSMTVDSILKKNNLSDEWASLISEVLIARKSGNGESEDKIYRRYIREMHPDISRDVASGEKAKILNSLFDKNTRKFNF